MRRLSRLQATGDRLQESAGGRAVTRRLSPAAPSHGEGFTLIELLVVMAISVILMGLVLGPVVQSFNLTRRAQAMVDAQDAARSAMTMISRELGQAMYVWDNTNDPVDLPVPDASGSGFEWVPLRFGKIDFVLPRITMHCNAPDSVHPPGEPRDYPRGNEAWPPCPVCNSSDVEARPKLPMEQDVTVVRYFVGLADNRLGPRPDGKPDNNGWVSPWEGSPDPDTENQVVLYRVEFSPYDPKLFPDEMSLDQRLGDEKVFYDTSENPDGIPFCEAWMSKARVIGIAKYQDLVEREGTSIKPTITFRISRIDNDTFAGAYSSDKSFEVPNAVPTVYRAAYGFWTDYQVTVYRDDYNRAYWTDIDPSGDVIIWKSVKENGNWTETREFNMSEYLRTGSVAAAKLSSGDLEMAFVVDHPVVVDGSTVPPQMGDLNRGTVRFALNAPRDPLAPAGFANVLDPMDINGQFHNEYDIDRSGARRFAVLDAFRKGSHAYFPNARVVPGSDVVVGPDMTPGAIPRRMVRYQRVPLNEWKGPGLNQYLLDFETGTIYFSSVWDQDIPEGDGLGNPTKVLVDYKIQFNRADDVVRGDYSTKSLIDIHLGMRMFDPNSGRPVTVELNKSVKVRNALR